MANLRENILFKGFKDLLTVCQGPAIGFICMPFPTYGFKRVLARELLRLFLRFALLDEIDPKG